MDDYQELEQQLRQTREWVDGLSSAEKAQLRPAPPQPAFNWVALASLVGALAFILLIGIFAQMITNPTSSELLDEQKMEAIAASSEQEVIEAAIAFATNRQLREDSIDVQVTRIAFTSGANKPYWNVRLQGFWLREYPVVDSSLLFTVSNVSTACTVLVEDETLEAYQMSCDSREMAQLDEYVSASSLFILPNGQAHALDNHIEIIATSSEQRGDRTRITVVLDYAWAEAEAGLAILHWGYSLDAEIYNMGDIIAPIASGSGQAVIVFEVADEITGEIDSLAKFDFSPTLRLRNSNSRKKLYFVPTDISLIEESLQINALQAVNKHIEEANEWVMVEERLAIGDVGALIIHHAMVDLVEKETLQFYHDQGIVMAGLGFDIEGLINNHDIEHEFYDTPLYYTYSVYQGRKDGASSRRGNDSLIRGGLTHFFAQIESILADP